MKPVQLIRAFMPFLIFLLVSVMITGCAARKNVADNSLSDSTSSNPSGVVSEPDDEFEDEFAEDDPFDSEDEQAEESTSDPLYYWNVAMHHVNDKLYFWILKPTAKGYRAVAPEQMRTGVKNFFHNLVTPIRFANCVLQGKPEKASLEFSRFIVNSTAGVLGFMDIAANNPDFEAPSDEDFGQTLGVYGLGNGVYIVWPFLGPSSLRDTVGMSADNFLNPTSYIDGTTAVGVNAFEKVNAISFRIGDYESLKDAAIDPYEAFRNAYMQYRKKQISE